MSPFQHRRILNAIAMSLLIWAGPFTLQAVSHEIEDKLPGGRRDENCKLSLRTPTEVNWRGPQSRGYDATFNGMHGERISFEIRNRGEHCDYSVRISPLHDAYFLTGSGGDLPFTLRPIDEADSFGQGTPLVIKGGYGRPEGTKTVSFMLDIEPGRLVQAGRYAQDLEIQLIQHKDDLDVLVDSKRIMAVTEVWPKVTASIGSNAKFGTNQAQIDLGKLFPGKRQSLDFSVQANTAYEIRIRSQNDGNLKHFRSDAMVPYQLTLDGRSVDPASSSESVVISSGNTSRTHDFQLGLADTPVDAPAGYYEDQITVTISAN